MLVSRKEGLSFLVLLFCCSAVQRNGAVQRKQGFGFVYLFQEGFVSRTRRAACFKNRSSSAASLKEDQVLFHKEPGVVQPGTRNQGPVRRPRC